jgi:hypothetical protein
MVFGVLANTISRTGGQPNFLFRICNKGLKAATLQPFMRFDSIARLIIVAAVLRGVSFAQNCPLDHAFMSGIRTGTINPNRMEAIAGLATARTTSGYLWAHNGGAISRIFLLETGSRAVADFILDRTLQDVQDIAVGAGATAGSHLIYLADIGGVRSSVVIGRFIEPTLSPAPSGVLPAPVQTYFTVNYPDGSHDARGLMVDPVSNDLFVVTFEQSTSRLYRITQQTLAANGTMTLEATLPIGLATASDISPDGSKISVRNVSDTLMWVRLPGQTIAQALAAHPRVTPILGDFENNGNALAFAHDNGGYYTTGQGVDPGLHFFARNTSEFTTGRRLAEIDHESVTEISGVAASWRNPGLLWMHNDGAPYETYLVNTDGTVWATFTFGTAIDDYEDIAVGPGPTPGVTYVYAGEIGDNTISRGEVRIFRFAEPQIGAPVAQVMAAGETVITMQYPDGPHDAEGLLVDPITGDLFVVTKENDAFGAYKATRAQMNSGAVVQLTLAASGNFGPVSGGAISPNGSLIALRHEEEARLWRRRAGESVESALARASEQIPVIGEPIEPNGEGITFTLDSRGYYTMSEGVLPTIYLFEPLAQPRFQGVPQITGNVVRVNVSGCDGSRIRLEGSNELVAWSTVGTGFVMNGVATIDSAGGATMRFYRAVVDGP